jgi:uncharacterized membrane protein YebE (DUF533 family)
MFSVSSFESLFGFLVYKILISLLGITMSITKMLAGLSKAKMMKGSGHDMLNSSSAMGLAASLLGSKRKKSKSKMGSMALVGGLAWKAYQTYTAKQAQDRAFNQGKYAYEGEDLKSTKHFDYAPENIDETRFDDVIDETNTAGQMLLLRAMVAAAHADGHIDTTERMKIFEQVEKLDLSAQEKTSLFDEMKSPWSLEQIVEAVPCSEAASEVYAVSAMAIDLNCIEARVYLNKLAALLCIPSALQASIEETIESSRLSLSV